ncbi:hypothetical protein LNP74_16905 [Klebsiella pneumoniae subsp. pneumoniae]|nr:hypothetical protein [Klebsiella pneumoniae subsp. pneumoniae]
MSYSGQFELLERANQKLEADGADDADDYLRAAVSGVPPRRRSTADYHQRAVRPCGRDLVPLLDGGSICRWPPVPALSPSPGWRQNLAW